MWQRWWDIPSTSRLQKLRDFRLGYLSLSLALSEESQLSCCELLRGEELKEASDQQPVRDWILPTKSELGRGSSPVSPSDETMATATVLVASVRETQSDPTKPHLDSWAT